MSDDERDAQERLRQAQEGRREAVEGVREAQEGVREMKERVGDESRQYGEAGRVTGEDDREDAETGRVDAEAGRVVAFDERTEAESGRVVAEEAREVAATGAKSERRQLRAEFYVIYTLLFAVMIVGAAWIISEGHQREDQFCESAEREHLTNVRQYRDTIEFLLHVKKQQPERLKSDPIISFVITRLPETERKARKDTAPPLCDGTHQSFPVFGHKQDIGRPEPDPVVPKITAKQLQAKLAAR